MGRETLAAFLAAGLCACADAPVVKAAKAGSVADVRTAFARNPGRRSVQEAACRAAAAGRDDVLAELVKDGALLDEPLPDVYFSLHPYSDWHSCPCVDAEAGNSWLMPKPAFGQSPLMCAAKFGRKETVAWLLDHGAKVNAHNQTERSYCIFADDRAEGKPMGYTALTFAAQAGHKDVVEFLLSRGADPSIAVPYRGQDCYDRKRTAADFARENGHEDVAALLERAGTSAPEDEGGGDSASHHTKFGHHAPQISAEDLDNVAGGLHLFRQVAGFVPGMGTAVAAAGRAENGVKAASTGVSVLQAVRPVAGAAPAAGAAPSAEIEPVPAKPRPELQVAAERGDTRAVKSLLAGGADARERSENDETALHYAALMGQDDAVAALLKAGAEVDARDDDGVTPLIAAALMGRSGAVRLLVDAKADLNLKNSKGDTALSAARKADHDAVADLLVKAGAADPR